MAKKLATTLIALAAVIAAFAYFLSSNNPAPFSNCTPSDNPEPSDPSEGMAAAIMCKRYLVASLLPNGRFEYINNAASVSDDRYNMLRHAGAIYSLAMYCDVHYERSVVETMKKASAFLLRQVEPIPNHEDMLAVWSDKQIEGGVDPKTAKLGGAGLALVALTGLERHAPNSVPLDTMRRIARFIVWMQEPDGSFISKYIPVAVGKDRYWKSLYYPGEAALGLAMLYKIDPDPDWLSAAIKAMEYLSVSRKGLSVVEADHWALLATAEILRIGGENCPREMLLAHAFQVANSIMLERPVFPKESKLYGCFSPEGRTTPTATRLEGLLAAKSYLTGKGEEFDTRLDEMIRSGIAFLVRSQFKTGKYAGGIPAAVIDSTTKLNEAKANEIRVDFVQHALSAFLMYKAQYETK